MVSFALLDKFNIAERSVAALKTIPFNFESY
jgi:hypothetical protein